MNKILTAIVILAVIWAIPQTRVKFTSALMPVLEKLGPAGDKIANPARKLQAESDLREFAREIGQLDIEGRRRPEDRTFARWLTQITPNEDRSVDPWGQPYWQQTRRAETRIGSSGVDGKRGTDDDIVEIIAPRR